MMHLNKFTIDFSTLLGMIGEVLIFFFSFKILFTVLKITFTGAIYPIIQILIAILSLILFWTAFIDYLGIYSLIMNEIWDEYDMMITVVIVLGLILGVVVSVSPNTRIIIYMIYVLEILVPSDSIPMGG